MSFDTAAGTELLTFLSPELGGNDTVFGGAGNDSILLSQGDDYVEAFGGDDLIAGDNATLTKNQNTGLHLLEADTQAFGGNDEILSGIGNDLIIGSFGADVIQTGTGDDFALGDLGNITFRNATDVESLTYTTANAGGNDVITATGTGSNILIGQFGQDTLTGAQEDDLLIGDLSELKLSSFENVLPGQSHLERIEAVVSIRPDLGFKDDLIGGDGNDMLIGGFGADSLLGGDGQDFLFGDMVDARRVYNPATQIETLELDTNFAFETGGYDTLDGGDGPDVLRGGLGPDLFFGNTQTDLLAGDAFAVKYLTFFPTGLIGPTPLRQIDEVNFAGFSAVDVLTNAQVGTSLGVLGEKFQSTYGREVFDEKAPISRDDLAPPPANFIDVADRLGSDPVLFLRVIEGFFDNEDIIRRISETVYFGVDLDLALEDLIAAFRAYLLEQGIVELDVDMVLFEAMLRRVLDDASQNPPPEEASTPVPASADSTVAQQPPV
jgi:Ca2+-binding RTX toxin-like protein